MIVSGLAGHSLGAGLAVLVSAALSTHSTIPVIGFRFARLSDHAIVYNYLFTCITYLILTELLRYSVVLAHLWVIKLLREIVLVVADAIICLYVA